MSDATLLQVASEASELIADDDIGSDHLVLALLDAQGDCVAQRALSACGLTYERALDLVRNAPHRLNACRQDTSMHSGARALTLEATTVIGRAQGVAAMLGRSSPQPEDILLSMLWEADSVLAWMLQRTDTTRECVLNELNALGYRVPVFCLQPARRWTEWSRVSMIEFERMAVGFRASGTRYRYAVEGDDVLVSTEDAACSDPSTGGGIKN